MSIPSGIVLIDKPPGITSFQALNTIKKRLNTGKVGHTGTLDRFASGLLIACVGKFTKLVSRITGLDKEYYARFFFGVQTDTLDPEGTVQKRMPVPELKEITSAIASFIGTQQQIPPVYSAVHVGGKRSYRLARRGAAVELPPREIRIEEIRIIHWQPPELQCIVRCSKGTYIRSLARDIGREAGSCAYTSELRRTKIGPIRVDGAVKPEDFSPDRDLISGRSCFDYLPMIGRLEIYADFRANIARGRQPDKRWFIHPPEGAGPWAVFDENGTFLALIEKRDESLGYNFVMSGI